MSPLVTETGTVEFLYILDVPRAPVVGARIVGSWDADGRSSPDTWLSRPMDAIDGADGVLGFRAEVTLDAATPTYHWGVLLDRRDGTSLWGVPSEVPDVGLTAQHRQLILRPPRQRETCRLSLHRTLGPQRVLVQGGEDALRFTVWAPNARAVEVAFGGTSGYIADDGYGEDPKRARLPMRSGELGVWEATHPRFTDVVGARYMFRITRDDGSVAWRTDMWSREQCGSGDIDPQGGHYSGDVARLDGTPSCSLVIDTRLVFPYPPDDQEPLPVNERDFWADELDPEHPVPRRVEDLVIYELHVGALGPDRTTAGTFVDALAFLPYLTDLGVNAVELLPMFEFNGSLSWGYGSSHFLAIETSAGGRDALKHFVKACHQRGIAVLMDVVYNHYTGDADRASWRYDSHSDSRNVYYWYDGREEDYGDPTGGYVDNESSGWAPRFTEPHVRGLFVSSAVMLVDEFHIDGLRVDQTTSIHAYNRLHADGRAVPAANIAGRKFLRELCQTLNILCPNAMLVAEDHSGWDAITQPAETGGVGFDAAWDAQFFHHLVGDSQESPSYARLLSMAGRGSDEALAMGLFADQLERSGDRAIVYAESHDEAGNASRSRRTIRVAVDGAPLVGETRHFAEARSLVVAALTLLSAGTPMFLMGEEVGAKKPYTYDRFHEDKEDIERLRQGTGAGMFACYRDLIQLRGTTPGLRSGHIKIVHVNDRGRVLAFRRWDGSTEVLVVASLANGPYNEYRVQHDDLAGAPWHERLSTDAVLYGGRGTSTRAEVIPTTNGAVDLIVPANTVLVLIR